MVYYYYDYFPSRFPRSCLFPGLLLPLLLLLLLLLVPGVRVAVSLRLYVIAKRRQGMPRTAGKQVVRQCTLTALIGDKVCSSPYEENALA